MKLYFAPGACSLSPHIVAEEAEIPLEYEKVDLKTHKTESGGDYYKVNPKGYVPALRLDGGDILTEGPAIVQFLADLKPAKKLVPEPGSFDRYRLMSWLVFTGTELHKQFAPLFQGGSGDDKAKAKEKIRKRLEYVNGALSGQDYLIGNGFSVADAYMFVMLTWAEKNGIPMEANLAAYYARIAKRPAVRTALRNEGLELKAA